MKIKLNIKINIQIKIIWLRKTTKQKELRNNLMPQLYNVQADEMADTIIIHKAGFVTPSTPTSKLHKMQLSRHLNFFAVDHIAHAHVSDVLRPRGLFFPLFFFVGGGMKRGWRSGPHGPWIRYSDRALAAAAAAAAAGAGAGAAAAAAAEVAAAAVTENNINHRTTHQQPPIIWLALGRSQIRGAI